MAIFETRCIQRGPLTQGRQRFRRAAGIADSGRPSQGGSGTKRRPHLHRLILRLRGLPRTAQAEMVHRFEWPQPRVHPGNAPPFSRAPLRREKIIQPPCNRPGAFSSDLGVGDLSLPASAGRRSEERTGVRFALNKLFLCATRAACNKSPENRGRTDERARFRFPIGGGLSSHVGPRRPRALNAGSTRSTIDQSHENETSRSMSALSSALPAGSFPFFPHRVGPSPSRRNSTVYFLPAGSADLDLHQQPGLAVSSPNRDWRVSRR